MLPFPLLLEHALAFVAVWVIVLLPGLPLAAFMRLRYGPPGWVLLGLVYWSVALYLLPFGGGLFVALVLAAFGFLLATGQHGPVWAQRRWRWRWANVVLLVGCGAYTSAFWWNYVPLGADASMVTTATRFIAAEQGLPQSYAPWFPDLFFPAVNLGLPSVGAVAVLCGCEPGSVGLALAVLSYSSWIAAVYLLLRLWVRPTPAAVLAVVQAWGARWGQNTISWGGFTTIAALAVGVFAVRVLWDGVRQPRGRTALVLGLSVGAMPLVHGVSAAVWLYAIAPVLGFRVLPHLRNRRVVSLLLLAGSVSVAVLACYLAVGRTAMSPAEVEWTQKHIREDAPTADSWAAAVRYLTRFSGSVLAYVGLAALVGLVAVRQWRAAVAVGTSWLLLLIILMNATWWTLPASMLLYPNRAVYWVSPLTAVALAILWQTLRERLPSPFVRRVGLLCGGALLAWSATQHAKQYQRPVAQPAMTADDWEALQWAKQNLQAPGTLVKSHYGTVTLYFPGVAGVPTDAWHHHHCLMEEMPVYVDSLPATHRLYSRIVAPVPREARIVFQNATVTIVEVTEK